METNNSSITLVYAALAIAAKEQEMFRNAVREMSGYEAMTTFFGDFTIGEVAEGERGVRDTFNRAFNEWKGNYKYLTELVIVLNHKIWEHYHKGNEALARVYDELWRKADAYACDNLKEEELAYFYQTTD